MTSPPPTTDAAPPLRRPAKPARHTPPIKFYALLTASLFAALVATHLPLVSLPYYWDEAGYFIPAARDLYLTGDPVPFSSPSNAHPPLVPAYVALAWHLFGFHVAVARTAMLLIAALALAGLFRLSERAARCRSVAWATVACTALYPVFFAQSSLVHLDVAAAALTVWGLVLYLPPRATREGEATVAGGVTEKTDEGVVTERMDEGGVVTEKTDEGDADLGGASGVGRRLSCVALFALAALAKETAVLAPLALAGWEVVGLVVRRLRPALARRLFLESNRPAWHTPLLLLALAPLLAWLFYHQRRTGYFFGNPEYFRYNVESTLNLARVVDAAGWRLRHVLSHMNLWALTAATAAAMLLPALRDAGRERRRIDARVQLVFAVVVAAYAVALSAVGGAVLARYMLPVVPLIILVCVSTLRRRVRRWPLAVAIVCAAFVAGLFWRPAFYSIPWEDNLAYRDFVLLHRRAARFIERTYEDPRVFTAWPARDELANPDYGYTTRPLRVTVGPQDFGRESLEEARRRRQEYDTALVFSTHGGPSLEELTAALGGRVRFREERGGQWVAVLEVSSEQ
jgi:4-amino-4-deoxy-L-arabinose transferase-like glycosyltransferase